MFRACADHTRRWCDRCRWMMPTLSATALFKINVSRTNDPCRFPLCRVQLSSFAQRNYGENNFGSLLDFISSDNNAWLTETISPCGRPTFTAAINLSQRPLATERQASVRRANVAFLHLSFSPSPLLFTFTVKGWYNGSWGTLGCAAALFSQQKRTWPFNQTWKWIIL